MGQKGAMTRGQKCEVCRKSKSTAEFMPSSSPFWLNGHINICYDCVQDLVDGDDLNQVDRLLQFANMAFMPQEWRKIWKREGGAAFKKYANNYYEFNYYKYDWGEQNEKLMEIARHGLADVELEELKPGFLRELKTTWGDLEESDLLWLENYYNSILEDYSVDTEAQRDQFRKICRMSLVIDKQLMKGQVDKDFMTQYNNLMTNALKNVERTQGDAITSVGQIVDFIEKRGYTANFYDGIPRDEIDMIEKNIKEYIADLVRGETNLPEIYAQAKQRDEMMEDYEVDTSIGAEDDLIDETEEDKLGGF